MGFWQDFWDADSHGWSMRDERAHKRNLEAGRLSRVHEMENLKRREVEALEKIASRAVKNGDRT